MAGVNKVILLGRLGRDPESRTFATGGKVVSFSMATSESWTDKASGEKKERTQWHRIVIFNEGIAGVAERFLKKGSEVYIEGQIETRKYTDKDGAETEITEIVLRNFRGSLTLVGGGGGGEDRGDANHPAPNGNGRTPKPASAARDNAAGRSPQWDAPTGGSPHDDGFDDDIPF